MQIENGWLKFTVSIIWWNWLSKQHLRRANLICEALGIQHYSLPKMSDTRFIGHRRRAFRTLLDMWPAFIMAYSNVNDNKTRA